MPAYFVVDNEVTDPVGFEEYRKQVPVTVGKYGGKFLVRGGQVQTLGGDWKPEAHCRHRVSEHRERPALVRLRGIPCVEGAPVAHGARQRGSGRRPALVRHAISRNIIVAVVMCSRSRVPLIASAR